MELKHAAIGLTCLALSCATGAAGRSLHCGQDSATDAVSCFDPRELQETNGIRHAPLYQGGPKGARKQSFSIHVNCASQVVHLKDRDGVSFGGGRSSDTEMLRQLTSAICSSPLPSRAPTKR